MKPMFRIYQCQDGLFQAEYYTSGPDVPKRHISFRFGSSDDATQWLRDELGRRAETLARNSAEIRDALEALPKGGQ